MRILGSWKVGETPGTGPARLLLLETTPSGRSDQRRLTWVICSLAEEARGPRRRTLYPYKDIGESHRGIGRSAADAASEAALRAGEWFALAVAAELAAGKTALQALAVWRLGDRRQLEIGAEHER